MNVQLPELTPMPELVPIPNHKPNRRENYNKTNLKNNQTRLCSLPVFQNLKKNIMVPLSLGCDSTSAVVIVKN